MVNFYYLIMMFLELFRPISDTNGIPAVGLPLLSVVGISMLKDIYEDFKRHISDRRENNKKTKASVIRVKNGITTRKLQTVRWKSIRVGQIVKVEENEYFPCDLVVLNSSEPNGSCFIETKNLDGETNLKHKKAEPSCVELCQTDENAIENFNDAIIDCEEKNEFIYKFDGKLKLPSNVSLNLGEEQILLRGSSLRNTRFIWGIAIYTGHDTKVMMNSANSLSKKSKLENSINYYLLMGMLIQFVLCVFAAIYFASKAAFQWKDPESTPYYLMLNETYDIDTFGRVFSNNTTHISPTSFTEAITSLGISFGKWVLILMNFVAISLLVSLEMVKFSQGIFIEWDWMMYDEEQDMPAKAQSSNLNEELGQVGYIFSDKTGTLTKNIMEFKRFSAGNYHYGENNEGTVDPEDAER